MMSGAHGWLHVQEDVAAIIVESSPFSQSKVSHFAVQLSFMGLEDPAVVTGSARWLMDFEIDEKVIGIPTANIWG